MDLPLLAAIVSAVLLGFPFTFAQDLYAGAINQEVQASRTRPVRNHHLKVLLPSAQGTEIRHRPIQLGHFQQAGDRSGGLPQRQAEQTLDHEAELDGRIRKGVGAATFAAPTGKPSHIGVKPDQQRTA